MMTEIFKFLQPALAILVLVLPACQQQDPAAATELVVLAAEKERLKGELEKAKAEVESLKSDVRKAETAVAEAAKEADKGIDKRMVQLSFMDAVSELQKKVEEKYPSDQVVSYKVFDLNFPSENPISSSVAFTMTDSSGTERELAFEGAANRQGVWNFGSVKEIAARKPVVKAPDEVVAQPKAGTAQPPPTQIGVIRRPSSNDKVFEIKWPD